MPRRQIIQFLSALLVLIGLVPVTPTFAQAPSISPDGPDILEKWLFQAPAREQFLAMLLGFLRRHDGDQEGLTAQDIEKLEVREAASARAQRVQRILTYDLDGDGRVTRDEVTRTIRQGRPPSSSYQLPSASVTEEQVDRIMEADLNRDNLITFDEMRTYQTATTARQRNSKFDDLKALLALDPNKDGRLTIDELTKLAEGAFQRYDQDGDKLLSFEELRPLVEKKRQQLSRPQPQSCELPKPSADEYVVVFGIYEGRSVSTVSVVGMDKETSTGKIVIEPGETPLYIILSSYDAVIWQFEGETKRVSRAFVIPRRHKAEAGTGVTGLHADQIHFMTPNSCFGYFYDIKNTQAQRVRSAIETAMGRPVDIFAGTYGLENVRLPSAEPVVTTNQGQPVPEGVDASVWRQFTRFYPGGLYEIDAAKVIAPKPVQRYDVLPQQAGLIQLMREGSITRRSDGRFEIVKPVARFPAGLNGAHAVTFLLGKGVPMPAGSPGHSCVISEDTGEPLRPSPSCRSR